jgi:tRNA pseudouridine55 synthase
MKKVMCIILVIAMMLGFVAMLAVETFAESYDEELEFDELKSAAEHFVGDIKQIPPMYSAIKVGGKKLVDLARQGIEIEREARDITVYSIDCKETDRADEFVLDVVCSKGTYIRTLCEDIGAHLGCGGTMAALTRVASGKMSLDNSYTLDQIEQMSEEERRAVLIETEELFASLPSVSLGEFFERLSRSGSEIYQKKIKTDYEIGQRVRICGKNGFFALGEVRDYPDGSAIKAIKTFNLE